MTGSNPIDRSIAFVRPWEPDFAARLRGVAVADLNLLEATMGRPCSDVYRAFLEHMGENAGSIDFGRQSTSVPQLLQMRAAALRRLPRDIELFSMPTDDDDDVYLVHDPAVVGDARLFRHPSLQFASTRGFDLADAEPVAGGFGELLCLPALNRHQLLVQPHCGAFTGSEATGAGIDRCREIAAAFGFEPYWFSNDWMFAAHAGDLVLVAKQAPGWVLSVAVAGPERYAWAAVAGTLSSRLGLEPYR
jgi:hypothetical protein